MIMTEVSAVVPPDRADDVAAAFAELLQRPLPDGLIRTELLAGRDGEWKVQTIWRDQAALDAMRAGPEPPAAPTLFLQLGAEPVLRIYHIRARHTAPSLSAGRGGESSRPVRQPDQDSCIRPDRRLPQEPRSVTGGVRTPVGTAGVAALESSGTGLSIAASYPSWKPRRHAISASGTMTPNHPPSVMSTAGMANAIACCVLTTFEMHRTVVTSVSKPPTAAQIAAGRL